MKLRYLLALVLAVALPASAAEHGESVMIPGGAFRSITSGCTKTENVGTNHDYSSMNCTTSSTPCFVVNTFTTPATTNTYKVHVFWDVVSGHDATKNVKFTIANGVCPAGNLDCDWDTFALSSGTALTLQVGASPAVADGIENEYTSGSIGLTPPTGACVSDVSCAAQPVVYKICRDNSVASNLPQTIRILGLRIEN